MEICTLYTVHLLQLISPASAIDLFCFWPNTFWAVGLRLSAFHAMRIPFGAGDVR